ncbi:MAG: hypothetical protein KME19_15835 [Microcoleus vaginatus WJT46-NPBG5]|jgi:hypothetical protein|nr:hypothetical protein [Microcoleus vaginatus WJT46-NPBG5]
MDEQLKKLIAEVCKYPEPSPEKQKALNRLIAHIQQLPGLSKSSHPDYLEALNRTWEWVSQNIHTFKPRPPSVQISLVKWINGYLYWRIQDLYIPDERFSRSLNEISENNEADFNPLEKLSETGFGTPSLSGIEGYIEQLQREEKQRIGLEIEKYIQQDPEGKLEKCHPKANFECNCRLLSKRLYLNEPPDKLSEIARELKINYQALVSHWKRKCLPLLQEIARNQGYQPSLEP